MRLWGWDIEPVVRRSGFWFSVWIFVCLGFLISQITSSQLLVITEDFQAVDNCIPLSVQRVNYSSGHLTAMRMCKFWVSQMLGKA